ncbi:glycosyltransferase [Rariglobus hedericola]|uniref:glycosyltransferase n=1 Tax=Rariglobus hedericola TaxID=2597822 RepID=UPI001396AB7B|nr:glycosyltransferase [Rariglobus hedericola]
MHYDFAIVCRESLGSGAGDIGVYSRLLIEALAAAGKRSVVFTGSPEAACSFEGNALVDYVVVETPRTAPYATVTGAEFLHAYALCTKLIEFLETHSIQTIEFPDRHAEGYFFINHNLVYRRIPSVAVRLHLPAFVVDDDNEKSPRSLHEARVYAAEKEALQRADHILYSGPAILERVLDYFTPAEAEALRIRATSIPNNFPAPLGASTPSTSLEHAARVKKTGCLGPLEYRRGADQLVIQACRYFAGQPDSTIQFHLIGEDTLTANGLSFSSYLSRLIPDAARDHFVFERPLAGAALQQQLSALDAFVLPARFDHHPAALNDILPLQKPVFVSTRGGMADLDAHYPSIRRFDPLAHADWQRFFIDLENGLPAPAPAASDKPAQINAGIIAAYLELKPEVTATLAPVRMSVVIAHLNDAENLTNLLNSLRAAKDSARLEIIVVDDGSPDDVQASLQSAFPGVIFLQTPQSRSGPFLARKIGTETAASDYVLFVDADDHLDIERCFHYAQTLAETDRLDVLIPAMRHFGRETHASLPLPKSRVTVLFECYFHCGLIARKTSLLDGLEDACRATYNVAHSEDWMLGISLLFTGARISAVLDCAYFYNRTRPNTRSLENLFMEWQSTAIRHRHFDQAIARALTSDNLPISDLKLLRLVALGVEPPSATPPVEVRNSNYVAWHTHLYRTVKSLTGDPNYRPLKKSSANIAPAIPVFRSNLPSGTKPRLLFITRVLPNAEGTGPARRAYSVISAMAKTHDVSLLWITPPAHDQTTPVNLPEGCVEWRRLPSHAGDDRELRRRRELAGKHPRGFSFLFRQPVDWRDHTRGRLRLAADLLGGERFDVIHAFRMVMAPYALAIHRANPARSIQLDTDDIESSTLGRIGALYQKNADPVRAAESYSSARINARLERDLFPRFHHVFVCSQSDASRLAPRHKNIRVLPNIMPVPAQRPLAPAATKTFRFLFLGTLDYYPNTDALLWLCREILPRLRSTCDCELVVAGLNAPASLIQFLQQQDGVRFIGAVAHSATAFAAADALLVPLRAGGGTRLKIIEAFTQGIPVVSTTLGIEGIEAQPEEHFLVADTPEIFARAACRLTGDAALRDRLAKNAFDLVSREYSPAALARALEKTSVDLS